MTQPAREWSLSGAARRADRRFVRKPVQPGGTVMSEREDERPHVNPGSTASLRDDDRQDPLDPAAQVPSADSGGLRPPAVHHAQRAAISAAAVFDRLLAKPETEAKAPAPTPAAAAQKAAPAVPLSADLNVVKRGLGSGDDGTGRVSTRWGRAPRARARLVRSAGITYDFYQRCHEAPGGPAGQGDGAEGVSVRQPQRYRKRARHGTRRTRGAARTGAGHGRSEIPSDSLITDPNQTFPVKLGAKTVKYGRTSSCVRSLSVMNRMLLIRSRSIRRYRARNSSILPCWIEVMNSW